MKLLLLNILVLGLLLTSCVPDPVAKKTTQTLAQANKSPITPTAIDLFNPVAQVVAVYNNANPTFKVSGVSTGLIVKIYTNAICTAEIGSATATSDNVNITTSSLAVGTYNLYAKTINAQSLSSACSGLLQTYNYQVAPNNFSYSLNPATYTINSPLLNPNIPSFTGDHHASFTISPDLNANTGLTFDSTTGFIFGTPTKVSDQTTYTIAVINSAGSTLTSINLRVAASNLAPANLNYSTTNAVYTSQIKIQNNIPNYSGGATSVFSIAPDLHASTGLTFDNATGIISGTPSVLSLSSTPFTVTATNGFGNTSQVINITINPAAPQNINYGSGIFSYINGIAIANNSPTVTGGAIASYTISPNLNSNTGLLFNSTTGVISGTPTTISAPINYTITGTNQSGTTSAIISIKIAVPPPTSLNYAKILSHYTINTPIAANGPNPTGGLIANFSVQPNLPTGLILNPNTGIITGTPTQAITMANYVITGANESGSVYQYLSMDVSSSGSPTNLSYSVNPAIYSSGATIINNAPSYLGGAPTSYTITPSVPAGLSLNAITGIISGLPTVNSAATNYTITATNSFGFTTAVVNLAVSAVGAPNNLTYATNPAIYTNGTIIALNAPTNLGGAITTYSVSPALPPGLSLNTSTGAITGTPTQALGTNNYIITGSNTNGSTSVALVLTVRVAAPAIFNYSQPNVTYTKSTTIFNNSPSVIENSGTTYAITPDINALTGLIFNSSNGIISGTPTAISSSTNYIVTASNISGSRSTNLTIQVRDAAPASLSFTNNLAIYTNNALITNNVPTTTGGTPLTYSIAPALPAGLIFNTQTGVISGTPQVVTPATTYNITAANGTGNTSVNIIITVKIAPPAQITYSNNPAVYSPGVAITSNTPSFLGGAPTSYTIVPSLPSGLIFNPNTGIISGTPNAVSPATNYTVTATNSSGTSSINNLNIAITLDGQNPTLPASMVLTSPASSPSNISNPVYTLTGVKPALTIKIYNDSACNTLYQVGSVTVPTTDPLATTATINLNLPTRATYNLYAKTFNTNGNSSACSNMLASYVLQGNLLNAKITYDAIPATAAGLNYQGIIQKPVRQVLVQLIDADSSSILNTFITDETGAMPAFVLPLSVSHIYFTVTATLNTSGVSIIDNTTAGTPIYTLQTSTCNVSGDADCSYNISSGWNGNTATPAYISGASRKAAPFAILDTIYTGLKAISDVRPNATFPSFNIGWSYKNVTSTAGTVSDGHIGKSFCDIAGNKIYLLGEEGVDTDEYDNHVIIHLLAQYLENKLSHTNSLELAQTPGQVLDQSQAWSEGFRYAFARIVLGSSVYVNTNGASQLSATSFDLANYDPNPGWFSAMTIEKIIYSLYDPAGNISFRFGLGPIYDLMIGTQKSTPAMPSIFTFIDGLKNAYPNKSSNIDTLISSYNANANYGISSIADKYGTGETHNAGTASVLPIYNSLVLNGPAVNIELLGFSATSAGNANSAYNNRYIKFTATTSTVTIGVSSTDAFRIYVYQNGGLYSSSISQAAPGSFSYSMNTSIGAEYIMQVNTDKNIVTNQAQPVDMGITVTTP